MKVCHQYSYVVVILFVVISSVCLCRQTEERSRVGTWKGKTIEYASNQVAVKIRSSADSEVVLAMLLTRGLTLLHDFDKNGWGIVTFPNTLDPLAVADTLSSHPSVESGTPIGVGHGHYNPNDPYYQLGYQWSLYNYGQQPTGGTPGADIKIRQAWDITRGNAAIVIGVLDSGLPIRRGWCC